MQLSKVLLVIGATSVCLTPLPGRTADKASVAPLVAPTPAAPDAVEKARAVMHQKMDELQPAAPAAASQAPAKAAPTPELTAPAPAPMAEVATPDAVEKARTVLRQKMDELQPTTPAPAPAPAVKAPAPANMAEAEAPVRPVIPVADPAAIEKAREALHQQMTELNSQPNPATTASQVEQPAVATKPQKTNAQAEAKRKPETKPKTTKELATNPMAKPMPSEVAMTKEQPKAQPEVVKPAKQPKKTKVSAPSTVASTPATMPGFEPLSGPPSPLSAAKQQRLSDLLVKYKADQITPEQYHAERAKILAEP